MLQSVIIFANKIFAKGSKFPRLDYYVWQGVRKHACMLRKHACMLRKHACMKEACMHRKHACMLPTRCISKTSHDEKTPLSGHLLFQAFGLDILVCRCSGAVSIVVSLGVNRESDLCTATVCHDFTVCSVLL